MRYHNRGLLSMNIRRNRNEWAKIISEYKYSGQTINNWCEDKNLNVNTFKYWIIKLNKEQSLMATKTKETDWIKLDNSSPRCNERTVKFTIGKAVIEVGPDFDPILLKNLVMTLVRLMLKSINTYDVYLACGATNLRNPSMVLQFLYRKALN